MITCHFENGHKANNLRHVTVDAILRRGDEILIIKRAPGMYWRGKFALPGGFAYHGENLQEAILREVKEETGYLAKVKNFLFVVDDPDRGDDRQSIIFVFLLEAGEKTGVPDHEVSEVLWHKIDNLPAEEEFAFDHYRIIEEYKKSLKQENPLPRFVSG